MNTNLVLRTRFQQLKYDLNDECMLLPPKVYSPQHLIQFLKTENKLFNMLYKTPITFIWTLDLKQCLSVVQHALINLSLLQYWNHVMTICDSSATCHFMINGLPSSMHQLQKDRHLISLFEEYGLSLVLSVVLEIFCASKAIFKLQSNIL
jgi:hypothetical protein